MTINQKVEIRNKKLGVLIRDARNSTNHSMKECAEAMGVTTGIYKSYEEGRRAPSLPELETLAYFLDLPISQFWSSKVIVDDRKPIEAMDIESLTNIRNKIIGVKLRSLRLETGTSLKSLSDLSGISTSRLTKYEMGTSPIPASVLEGLVELLGKDIDEFVDQDGPIGQWLDEGKAIQDFLELPHELRMFVCKPINKPYLELALSLSGLSTERLRSVAETLLDITL
ncbi:MAG: helix-turn-helix domain-containing protein [Anaerolineales bacterium]